MQIYLARLSRYSQYSERFQSHGNLNNHFVAKMTNASDKNGETIITQKEMKYTYRVANFRGAVTTIGKRKKQMKKHTAAPKLHAKKMRRRSHRLTKQSDYLVRYDLCKAKGSIRIIDALS
jgi:hypothetical protein